MNKSIFFIKGIIHFTSFDPFLGPECGAARIFCVGGGRNEADFRHAIHENLGALRNRELK